MQFEFFCKACTLLCINICMIIMTPPSPLIRDFPLCTCIFNIYFAVKITAIFSLLKIILGILFDGLAFGNRHIKAELCVGLSSLGLFHVGHVLQSKWSVSSLAWHELFSKRMIQLLLSCLDVTTPNKKISRRYLADYVRTLHRKAFHTCATIIFPNSTNQISDLWRWRCNWRRHFSLRTFYRNYCREG